jgi:hypothetical protein
MAQPSRDPLVASSAQPSRVAALRVASGAVGRGTATVSKSLPSASAQAQFLNVIESVFSGMARAVIHNSYYATLADAQAAITRYLDDRNRSFAMLLGGSDVRSGQERNPAAFALDEQLQRVSDTGTCRLIAVLTG